VTGFAEVRFKGSRRDYYAFRGLSLRPGSHVIVEADRGEDLGEVSAMGSIAERKCSGSGGCSTPTPEKRIMRIARAEEVERRGLHRSEEDDVRSTTRKRVQSHGLKMKITEAEWQFDRNKLIIYFTADGRVDFRELVRDLARTFRTRIELRQIGVRDEAALLGGVGRCGRELCCSTWLPELRPVSLQLAKDQRLSLNPAQISGCCGRLMCCLVYEHDTYVQARRRFPREGRTLRTSRGREEVVEIDIWSEHVTLRDEEGTRRSVALDALKREMAGGSERESTEPESTEPESTEPESTEPES